MDRKEPLQTVFFETEIGNQPVRDFILDRTREDRKEIGSVERNENGKRTINGVQEVNKMNGIGQNFDDFMIEQGLYDEAQELAEKKLIVLKREMEAQKLSKSNVAEKMHTSHVASEFRASTIQENSSEIGEKGGRLRVEVQYGLRNTDDATPARSDL